MPRLLRFLILPPTAAAAVLLAGACQAAPSPTRSADQAPVAQRPASPAAARHSAGSASGFVARTFRKPSARALARRLTARQFDVTQRGGTEPPFRNRYWNNKADGVYVDIVSGEPLFSSRHKFASGTGWPSFTRPLVPDNVVQRKDTRLGMQRVEVRSRHANSHLGHLFADGPPPTGLRYCINSAALRFIPRDQLGAEGYADLVE